MSNILKAIEENDLESFKAEVIKNPSVLDEIDEEGWSILNICIEYEMQDFVEYIVPLLSNEQIINQKPGHPILFTMETNRLESFNILVKNPNIDLNYQFKAGENLILNSFYKKDDSYFKLLLEHGADPYQESSTGISAFSLCIDAKKDDFINLIYNPNDLSEKYKEFFLHKAIQRNNHYAFDILFPHTQLDADSLFDLAVGFNNIYAISKIMETEGFIPGYEQLQALTELMCVKHENSLEKEATSEVIDFLFAIKTPFNQFVNKAGQSAWMLAIENDNVDVFSKLIKTSESVNLTDADNHSPLMYAIQHKKPEFVSLLLKKKANPNHLDRYNNTPLILAVKKGNREIVQELLKYPTRVNEVNQNHETALNLAVKNRRMDLVSDLIWAGGELVNNPAHFVNEENIFHFNFNNEYEKLLTNYDEKTIDNFLALSTLGFNLNEKNSEGDSYLHHFIKNGFLANFKTYLRCPLNPNQLDANNNTPAMCAMNKNSNAYITGLFSRFGDIDLTIKNNNGDDIYDICAKHKRADRMELLVKYDDRLNATNAKKAIFLFAQYGGLENNWDKLQSVLKNKNIKDDFENTLLMLCIAGDNKKDYDFLLKNNFASNLKEKNNKEQSIYQLLELLPPERKQEYKESILYYSQINDESNLKKPT